MGRLLIGWAEESIVPEKKVSLAGQFFERISGYVESEISVTAMAVEADGNEKMILISADVIYCQDWLIDMVRDKFAEYNTGVDAQKLMIAATHTHTSHVMQPSKSCKTESQCSNYFGGISSGWEEIYAIGNSGR